MEPFDALKRFKEHGGDLILPPDEYEGPLEIDHPCVVDGGGATLWAQSGRVLRVTSRGVTLRRLRIEVTGDGAGEVALSTNSADTVLEDVSVCGALEGFGAEDGAWKIPSVIRLGDFAAGEENVFSFVLETPVPVQLWHGIKGVTLSPTQIGAGRNEITVQVEPMQHNTILYGELLLISRVSRRVYLLGKSLRGAPVRHVWSAAQQSPAASPPPAPPQRTVPPSTPHQTQMPVTACRGQRIAPPLTERSVIKIAYEHRAARETLETDAYTFLLDRTGHARGDNDLIFFGNTTADGGAVRLSEDGPFPSVAVEVHKLPSDVDKIAFCYSVYGDDPRKNFSLIDAPVLRVFIDEKEWMRFPLDGLREEKTVVAAELYRHKGEWKLKLIGAGYRSGLKTLCDGYGIEVE